MSTADNYDKGGNHQGDNCSFYGAVVWLVVGGGVACALTLALAVTDYKLSHSPKERVLGETLNELRTAQSSLSAGHSDWRNQTIPLRPFAELAVESAEHYGLEHEKSHSTSKHHKLESEHH